MHWSKVFLSLWTAIHSHIADSEIPSSEGITMDILHKDTVQNLLAEARFGLNTFARAVKISVANKTVINIHRKLLLQLLLLCVMVYVVTHLLVMPLRIILWLSGASKKLDVSKWGGSASALVPLVTVWVVVNLNRAPLEAAFFATLMDVDPELAKETQKKTPRSLRETITASLKRAAILLAYAPAWALLSLVPGLSLILKFILQLYTLGSWLEPEWATAAAALSVFGATQSSARWLTTSFISQMLFYRQILEPYFSRQSQDSKAERKLITRRRVATLAFLLPLQLAASIPYVGPLTCIMAHAIAGVALKDLVLHGPEPATTEARPSTTAITNNAPKRKASSDAPPLVATIGDVLDSKKQ